MSFHVLGTVHPQETCPKNKVVTSGSGGNIRLVGGFRVTINAANPQAGGAAIVIVIGGNRIVEFAIHAAQMESNAAPIAYHPIRSRTKNRIPMAIRAGPAVSTRAE